jgi:hypothetical protein
MTVYIEKPEVNLREELADLRNQTRYEQELFWFDGDGSTTTFSLEIGWKPKFVYVNGALFREGVSEDYTVSYDGFTYSVEMAVAPSTVDVGIISERLV